MQTLPSLRVLTEEEMNGCSEGACCNCGLCCTAFEIRVPAFPYESKSPAMQLKPGGEPCPHLVSDTEGRELCGIHAEKQRDPRLAVCRGWDGRFGAIEDLREALHECLTEPKSRADIDRYQQMLVQGKLRNLQDMFRDYVNLLACIDNYVVQLDVIPHDLFEAFGLREAFLEYSGEALVALLEKTGIDLANTDHLRFLAEYAPHALAKEA